MLLRHRRHNQQRAPRELTEPDARGGATQERLVKELPLLRRVSTALSQEREVAAILQTAVATCRELFGFDHVIIGTIEGDQLVRRGHDGLHDSIQHLPTSKGIRGRVVHSGIAELVRDVTRVDDFVPIAPGSTMQSMMAFSSTPTLPTVSSHCAPQNWTSFSR